MNINQLFAVALFSVCEEPFVQSGDQCMAFFWKGDQLFTKRGPVNEKDASPMTTFYLKLRDPVEAPNVASFGRFLATSLAFTKNLRNVEVGKDRLGDWIRLILIMSTGVHRCC
jgi:hypothetical protein